MGASAKGFTDILLVPSQSVFLCVVAEIIYNIIMTRKIIILRTDITLPQQDSQNYSNTKPKGLGLVVVNSSPKSSRLQVNWSQINSLELIRV